MPKYKVYAIASATWEIGEYEADSPEEAEKMANEDDEAEWMKSLCHQCANEVELGDCYKTEISETDESSDSPGFRCGGHVLLVLAACCGVRRAGDRRRTRFGQRGAPARRKRGGESHGVGRRPCRGRF